MLENGDGHFPTTQWTLISRLRNADEQVSSKALDELCAQYHYPLYCYIRWRGLNHHDAEDALHDFMSKLLRLDSLKDADKGKGSLRAFLAVSLQRFLISQHKNNDRHACVISADSSVEMRFAKENFPDAMTPEKVLERSWAATVLQMSYNDLTAEEAKTDRAAAFPVLSSFLWPDSGTTDYAKAAKTLDQAPGTIRQMVRRLRDRFRKHLRQRIAETLIKPTPEEIDEEMRALRAAMLE